MGEEIFRKKSIDKIKSPESLNDYVQVSNPGVWLLIVCVILLLAGVCVWGVFGHIDSTVSAEFRVENGVVTCMVDDMDISRVEVGMPVEFGDCKGVIAEIGGPGEDGYACVVDADEVPEYGAFEGRIVIRSIRPASLVIN